ncbi:ATP synthase F0 subunit B [Acetobacteraceae bacterium]|nr:ATP synthase F0 subunit B [Acetobacteraceae bacterium]
MRSKISSLCAGRGAKILFVAGGVAFPALSHAEGMPQLELGNWLVQAQVFWGAGIFFLFMLALRYSVMPHIEKILAEREARIEADLAYAKQAQIEAENLKADIEAEIQASRLKIQKNMQDIADQNRQRFKVQEAELRQQMQAKMLVEVGEMELSVQEAKKDLHKIFEPVAEFIVGRCLSGSKSLDAQNSPEKLEARNFLLREHAQKYHA